jgi:hypothetical protein
MEQLPKEIAMVTTVYGDGLNGYAFQISRNKELKIQCNATRLYSGGAWTELWSCDRLQYRWYKSYGELCVAMADPLMKLEDFAPLIVQVERSDPKDISRCWACRGQNIWRVRAKTCWRDGDLTLVSACEACLPAIKADPIPVIERRQAWVRERLEKFVRATYDKPSHNGDEGKGAR